MQPSSDRHDRHDRHETANDRHTTDSFEFHRVTVPQAAQILGTTPDAVRSRLRRGKLRKDTAEDGTVLVVLPAEVVDGQADGHDGHHGQADGQVTVTLLEAKDQTIEHLSSELEFLREQLREEREESRRKDHLLAAALERIPAIEPPQDTPSESGEDAPRSTTEETSGTQTPRDEKRRPWYKRLFEG